VVCVCACGVWVCVVCVFGVCVCMCGVCGVWVCVVCVCMWCVCVCVCHVYLEQLQTEAPRFGATVYRKTLDNTSTFPREEGSTWGHRRIGATMWSVNCLRIFLQALKNCGSVYWNMYCLLGIVLDVFCVLGYYLACIFVTYVYCFAKCVLLSCILSCRIVG